MGDPLPSSLVCATGGATATNRRPRAVVAGLGSWGRRLLPRVDEAFDVVAVVSTGSTGSRAWTGRHHPGIPHLTDLDVALALPGIDAAVLATPTGTHADLAERALEAGCQIFVEKPLALDPDDAGRVTRTAPLRGLEVFTGYVYLFHPALDRLRSLAPPDAIRSLHFDWGRPELSGTIHEELLCHDLALTVALTGELPWRVDVLAAGEGLLRCALDLPSGRRCTTSASARPAAVRRRSVELHRVDGVSYTWRDDEVTSAGEPGRNLVQPQPGDALQREVAAFRDAVTSAGPRMVDDVRLSIGIATLLRDVRRSLGASA